MSRISKIEGIDTNVAKSLKAHKIKTTGDLWGKIGKEFDDGIEQVANDTGLEPDEIITVLAKGAEQEQAAGISVKRWIFYLIIVLLAIWFVWRIIAAVSTAPALHLLARNQVISVRDLPAYHILEEQDLELKELPTATGGFEQTGDLIGYYLTQPIKAGEPLKQEFMSSVKLATSAMIDNEIVTISFATGKVNPTLAQGDEVTLLLVPDTAESVDQAPVEAAVIILNVDSKEDEVILTMAINEERLDTLKGMMGISEFFILQQAK